MLVSALLTSVGINSALCVLYFVLYSILRKQPGYYDVYIPRLLADGISKRGSGFNFDRFIPSASWVSRAWSLSEDDILVNSGLDTFVFMRAIAFSLKVFTFAGAIGIFVLLPVNCTGNALKQLDIKNLTNNSVDVFSISNVVTGSPWLWVHFFAIYALTIFVCCLLYYEYKDISLRRIAYYSSSKPLPHQFTVLVHAIPVSSSSSVSDSVETFFKENHPSTYLSHVVIRRTNKLRGLLRDAKSLYRRISHLQSGSPQEKYKSISLFGKKIDLVNHYEKKLEDVEENVRLELAEASVAEDTRAAFVSFKSRYATVAACHMQQSNDPTRWVIQPAPEPNDVYWPFFSSSFMRRWISKMVVIVMCLLLTALFLIPVVLVQGLTNLSQLEVLFPFLKSLLAIKFISEIVTGYLPSLILQLFLKIVPPIMFFLSSIQGHISVSDIERSACNKVLWFTIWNIFIATVFSGSILYQLSIFLDPENIPAKLAVSVPAQASFFIAYVVTYGWAGTLSELFQIIPFIGNLMSRCCTRSMDDEIVEAPSLPYHKEIPRLLFFGLLGITYFFLAPLILPFLLIYLCLAYMVFRNQLINVYTPRYETAGKLWPIVHNSVIFSLLLMHAIAVGIFTLKKLSFASTLMFPLASLTLLFNEYCRKRFRPNFSAYSVEVLRKKDSEDVNDPTMAEFFSQLESAYRDPALMPVQYSSHSDNLVSPLLPSTVA